MICVGSAGIRNCDTFYQTRCIFTAKDAAMLELRCFIGQRTAARPSKYGAFSLKCGAYGGRKCHNLRHFFKCCSAVCCILFDAYRTVYQGLHSVPILGICEQAGVTKQTFHFSHVTYVRRTYSILIPFIWQRFLQSKEDILYYEYILF